MHLFASSCIILNFCNFLNFCPHVSRVKFHTDHFVSSAVHAVVGYLDSDINKGKIACGLRTKEKFSYRVCRVPNLFLGRSRPRLNMDFVN